MINKNNSPIQEEVVIEERTEKELVYKEQATQTQLGFDDILKERIKAPQEFIELKTVGKNYICSTQGWPKEPVCERYGFSANGKWIQLDIPREIMKELELNLGEEITYPIFIFPMLLEKNPDEFGGITLESEKDVFVEKPLTEEKETQTELSGNIIANFEEMLEEKDNQINQLNRQIKELEEVKKVLEENFVNDKKEWEKQKGQLEQWLKMSIRIYSATCSYYLPLRNITNEFDLNFIFSYGRPWLEISDSPNLTKPKLPDNLRGFKVKNCPNLKKLEFPASTSYITLDENWQNSGTIDISSLEGIHSLILGRIYLDGSEKTTIKSKIIFHKSQREKENSCGLIYSWNSGKGEYKGYSYSSLNSLISKGIITNYEEKN